MRGALVDGIQKRILRQIGGEGSSPLNRGASAVAEDHEEINAWNQDGGIGMFRAALLRSGAPQVNCGVAGLERPDFKRERAGKFRLYGSRQTQPRWPPPGFPSLQRHVAGGEIFCQDERNFCRQFRPFFRLRRRKRRDEQEYHP